MNRCEFCKKSGVSCIDYVDSAHCPNSIPLKTKPRPNKKLSHKLENKKQLTKEQLSRFRGEVGKGLTERFDSKGKYSIELTRRLLKAKSKAKKFLLYSDDLGRRIFIADRELTKLGREETAITFEKSEALLFYDGFDDIELKKQYYSNSIPFIKFNSGPNTMH